MKLFCNLNFDKKTIIITEEQAKSLKQINEKKYHINTDIKDDKEYIYPAKISVDEFKNKLTEIYDKYKDEYGGKPSVGSFVHRFCSYWKSTEQYPELKELAKDIKIVNADGENCDIIGDIRTIKNGIPYVIAQKGGDWEIPVLFMVYYDGNNIRAYFPKKGNTINLDDMAAFQGISSERDKNMPYLKKQFPNKTDDELIKISEKLHYNINLCIKDFEDHIKRRKKVNENYFNPIDLLSESLLFEADLKDIYQKYYNNIPEETFWNIVKADPTYNPQKEQKMGKYGKWLLNLFRQNKLKPEDLYKATDYLNYFVKYYNKIEQKDINQYDGLPMLYNTIKPFKDAAENGNEMATSKSDEIRKIKEDAEKFYEDDTWLVVIPHTQEAACYYGKNTEWCTAATSSYNMFNQYYNKGLLYININKKTNRKYQFHFETNSFMNENDEPIKTPIISNIPLTQNLLQQYVNKYGGHAIIALTKFIDLEEEDIIIGKEPYYAYTDYDGYVQIVKHEGMDLKQCNTEELSVENDVRYLEGCIFTYRMEEQEYEYYDEENDEFYTDTWEPYMVIFNAATRQTIEGDLGDIYPLNNKYLYYTNKGVKQSVVVNSETLQEVVKLQRGEVLRSPKDTFYLAKNLVDYSDDILIYTRYLKKDEIGPQSYGKDINVKLCNLKTGQYIVPNEFVNTTSGYRLNATELKDGKSYMVYQGYLEDGTGYGATPAYVIVNPDGSLSKVLTENKNEYFNNLINESVKNILFEQYLLEATLDDIYTKYYSDIPQEEFWQIIKTDPTWSEQSSQKMGKYGKWLLNQYKQGKLKMEDLYKYRESLEAFHKYNRQLAKKDIMAYGDGNSLYDAVKQFIDNPDQATSKSDEIRRMKQNAEKVYEDDEWLILIPKTEEAAKYYGKGTRWCTAAEKNNYFNYYNQDGPLYININKQNGDKYQFHFESEQFMDSSDTPIVGNISDTIELSDGAKQYYESIGKGYEINEKEYDDPDAEPEEETLYEGEGWSVTKYPDGDYVYIYSPNGENYDIDLYNPSFEEPACNIFPIGVIEAISDQLSYSEFYNFVFGTDSRVYTYLKFEKTNSVLQLSHVEGNNNLYDGTLFKVNEDYSFEPIIDFTENGLYLTAKDVEEVRRNTGFGNIHLHDPQTDKMNIYDVRNNSFMFKENIDKFCGFYMPSGYIFSINNNMGYVNIRNSDQEYTIPPMSENQKIEVIGARENIAMVKFEGIDGYGIYLLNQHKYALNEIIPSFSMIESSKDDGSYTRNILGALVKGKEEKYISTYDLPKEIQNRYNNAASYYPNSNMPVVLNDGTVTNRKQYWQSQGVYDILMQEWQKYI